ncbi:hypothetical protein [Listeria phage List-36]|uniref:Tail assembly chaperone n=20 Tax=Pecentumvirus TaxID=1857844 RepID=S4U847_9CAUD|nr:tail assembly chaperone [Listeria phage A511]YP_007676754.1 tail assembly chaperone [Listeria phage vB_LmoM_AG20]YP_008240075.1 hypothetical protein QLX35_gp155 [Listeria phage LP-125]YP_009043103.1 tail assembly chaperone [Listeria phage LMSP-25]YP_009043457.1 tail assembly chaperone [Listeria phage List-36]YP_009044565.1 tail assembly chaperone [Listeria phage LP-083-2]YP_009055688.1 tail assembly chaperone [Listeria phage LMTA-148]YP_009592642.1 tail assembly chaperone [Listeria phage 
MSEEQKVNEEQIEESKEKMLTKEDIDRINYEQQTKQKKTLDRIIKGVNDVWTHEYDFKELDLKFTIRLRAPNALEQATIQANREAYLKGTGALVSDYIYTIYHTLATIRTVGVDIPKELAEDDNIYNTAILYQIGRDFAEWLDTFRY